MSQNDDALDHSEWYDDDDHETELAIELATENDEDEEDVLARIQRNGSVRCHRRAG